MKTIKIIAELKYDDKIMHGKDKENTKEQGKDEVFDVKITNGAGKLLRQLMDHFGFNKSKDAIALALQLLDKVKDSEITVKRKDGTIIRLDISAEHEHE